MYYLVIRPIDHLGDKVFHSPEKAAQFAEITAEKYDQSSGNTRCFSIRYDRGEFDR